MSADFKEGQYWSYKTRTHEKGSFVLINKIESNEKYGDIYHISIAKVKVKNPMIDGGISTDLPHFPVSEATLNKSVTTLLGVMAVNQEYLDGYKTWKEAFDSGKAGVFTIDLKEIVNIIEQSINQ